MKSVRQRTPEGLDGLRYQLLHATAATILEAERRGACWRSSWCSSSLAKASLSPAWRAIGERLRNSSALSEDSECRFESGRLYGPFASGARTPDGRAMSLLVGEAISQLS